MFPGFATILSREIGFRQAIGTALFPHFLFLFGGEAVKKEQKKTFGDGSAALGPHRR